MVHLRRKYNEEITIYGDGSQTRSFCYADDLIDGFLKMMATSDEITGPINLGNPDEFTVKELAEKVLQLTDSKSKLIFKDLPVDDPTRRCPNITLAKQVLNWEPTIKLENGLLKTIEYFRTKI